MNDTTIRCFHIWRFCKDLPRNRVYRNIYLFISLTYYIESRSKQIHAHTHTYMAKVWRFTTKKKIASVCRLCLGRVVYVYTRFFFEFSRVCKQTLFCGYLKKNILPMHEFHSSKITMNKHAENKIKICSAWPEDINPTQR